MVQNLLPPTYPLLIKISTGISQGGGVLVHDDGDLEWLALTVLSPSAGVQPVLDLGGVGAEVEEDFAQAVLQEPLQAIVQQWPGRGN